MILMANQNTFVPSGLSAIPTKLWSCLYCGIKFDSKMNLKNHGLEVHPLENNFYKSPLCSECGCVFQQFKFYMYHIQSTGHMKNKYKDIQKEAIPSNVDQLKVVINSLTGHDNGSISSKVLGLLRQQANLSNLNLSTSSNRGTITTNPTTSPMQLLLHSNQYQSGNNNIIDSNIKSTADFGFSNNHSCIVSYTDSRSNVKVQMNMNQALNKRKQFQFSVYFGVPHKSLDTPRGLIQENVIYAWWLSDNFKPSNNMVANNVETYPADQFPSVILLELQALISSLRFCLSHNINTIKICGTSELLQRFLSGDSPRYFKTVYHTIREDLEIVINQLKQFSFYELELISIEDNAIINQLI